MTLIAMCDSPMCDAASSVYVDSDGGVDLDEGWISYPGDWCPDHFPGQLHGMHYGPLRYPQPRAWETLYARSIEEQLRRDAEMMRTFMPPRPTPEQVEQGVRFVFKRGASDA